MPLSKERNRLSSRLQVLWESTIESTDKSVYFIADDCAKAVKIGVARSPTRRLRDLQVANSNKLRLLYVLKGKEQEFETKLHSLFSAHRLRGEWFSLAPLTEPISDLVRLVGQADGTYRSDYNLDLDPFINPLVRATEADQGVP